MSSKEARARGSGAGGGEAPEVDLRGRGVEKRTLVVGGIPVDVFSQPGATPQGAPVVAMFLLHGRNGSAKKMEGNVVRIFEEVSRFRCERGNGRARDLIVVTFVSWLIALFIKNRG